MDSSGHLQSMQALWEPAGNKLRLSTVMPAVLSTLGEVTTSSSRHTTSLRPPSTGGSSASPPQLTNSMPSLPLGENGPIVMFNSSFSFPTSLVDGRDHG